MTNEEMDEERAKGILGDDILHNNSLYNNSSYLSWKTWTNNITLDGDFDVEYLEAIVWWMKNKALI